MWVRLREARNARFRYIGSGLFTTVLTIHRFPQLSCILTMATGTQGQNDVLSSLNTAIGALNLAKESTGVTPARTAFTSASALLTLIKVGSLPVSVGKLPADMCRTRQSKKRTTSNWD